MTLTSTPSPPFSPGIAETSSRVTVIRSTDGTRSTSCPRPIHPPYQVPFSRVTFRFLHQDSGWVFSRGKRVLDFRSSSLESRRTSGVHVPRPRCRSSWPVFRTFSSCVSPGVFRGKDLISTWLDSSSYPVTGGVTKQGVGDRYPCRVPVGLVYDLVSMTSTVSVNGPHSSSTSFPLETGLYIYDRRSFRTANGEYPPPVVDRKTKGFRSPKVVYENDSYRDKCSPSRLRVTTDTSLLRRQTRTLIRSYTSQFAT